MRLVATLLVRDEADVVAATIEHLLGQGAAHVLVTDNGSVDGTRQILEDYAGTGRVSVIDEPDHTYRQSRWVTRMARAACDHGADWVINADADEFWVPKDRSLTLAGSLAGIDEERGRVVARRTDLLGRRGAAGPWPRRLVWRDLLSLSQKGTRRGPKTAHRAHPDVVVAQGNHAVDAPIGPPVEGEPWDLYHVPLRSWPQFERAIVNGGSAYAANTELGPEIGWHWRADYARHLEGTLRAAYEGRLPTWGDLARRVRAGEVRRDTFLRDHLTALRARAVLPDRLAAALDGRT